MGTLPAMGTPRPSPTADQLGEASGDSAEACARIRPPQLTLRVTGRVFDPARWPHP
jgi:hypothetical protein